MNEAIIIKKLNEISKWIDLIIKKSKPIHELDNILGENLFVAVSDGERTGKFKIPDFTIPDFSADLVWNDVDLILDNAIHISKDKLSYNFKIDNTNILNGFLNNSLNDGAEGNIRNGSDSAIRIRHNVLNLQTVNLPIFLSNEMDYFLQPNELLSYKYSKERNQIEMSVYDTSSFKKLIKKSEIFTLQPSELEGATLYIKLSEIPSQDEFVDIFINGAFVNPDDYLVEDNNIILAKSNIDYDIKAGMKITVNYKY